jgi:hypothetical protein
MDENFFGPICLSTRSFHNSSPNIRLTRKLNCTHFHKTSLYVVVAVVPLSFRKTDSQFSHQQFASNHQPSDGTVVGQKVANEWTIFLCMGSTCFVWRNQLTWCRLDEKWPCSISHCSSWSIRLYNSFCSSFIHHYRRLWLLIVCLVAQSPTPTEIDHHGSTNQRSTCRESVLVLITVIRRYSSLAHFHLEYTGMVFSNESTARSIEQRWNHDQWIFGPQPNTCSSTYSNRSTWVRESLRSHMKKWILVNQINLQKGSMHFVENCLPCAVFQWTHEREKRRVSLVRFDCFLSVIITLLWITLKKLSVSSSSFMVRSELEIDNEGRRFCSHQLFKRWI